MVISRKRLAKHRRTRLEKHRKPLPDDTIITMTCTKCGHIWEPDPKKWRNFFDISGERKLTCSRCGYRILVPQEWIGRIWKHNA